MSKLSQTAPAPLPNLSPHSAWSKGPPPSSRPQSPANAPDARVNAAHTHVRRASNLGQGIPPVRVPRGKANMGPAGPAVEFGSIKDVNDGPPISPSPPPVAAVANVVAPKVNGNTATTSIDHPRLTTPPSTTPLPSAQPPATPKLTAADIKQLFQNPSSSTVPTSHPSSESTSPAVRPLNLPQQQPHLPQHQSLPSSTPPSAQQPSQHGSHPYTFAPTGGLRPQQQNTGPGGGPGSGGPRSPGYSRQMANGAGPRPPAGSNISSGGAPPMSSPRLAPHHVPGQATTGPSPQPIPAWPPPYHYPPAPEYVYYYHPQWQQQMMQHAHQHPSHPHHPPPPGPPHHAIPMSPRTAPPQQLQGVPGTPTQAHALPAPHSASSHAPSNSIGGVTSPPATPSAASGRLKVTASAFVPGRKVIIKNPNDGQEVNLEALNKSHVAAQPPHSPGPSTTNFKTADRRSVRVESEEARKKRLAEEDKEKEIQQSKREAVEKSKREQEMKAKEEEARRKKAEQETEAQRLKEEEEKRRKAEEEERIRKEKEAEEAQKLRQAAEEKRKQEEAARLEMEKRRQEEEAARLEMEKRQEEERLRKEAEETERLRKEAELEQQRKAIEEQEQQERLRKEAEEQEKAKAAEAAAAAAEETTVPAEELEEGELEEHQDDLVRDKVKCLRIDTSPPLAEPSRKRPDPLDLRTSSKSAISPPLPSALATARNIEDLSHVSYPEGVKSPKVELNVNAKDGKFRYDRDFLLQFMSVCKDKPDNLPPLDAIGLELTDQPFYMNRGSSGRNRQSSGALPPPSRGNPIGLGFTSGAAVFGPPKGGPINSFNMGQFQTSKPTSEERYALSTRAASNSGSSNNMQFRPAPMVRSASQGGPGSGMSGSGRVRSKRGEKRDREPGKPGSGHGQGPPLFMLSSQAGVPIEHVAPLNTSANAWAPMSMKRQQTLDVDAPEVVDRKVKGLLNRLTMERFESISDQIITWANKSEKEKDGRTLIQVIKLVFEKATDEAPWSEMYARLCRKMMEQISPKVQDDGIKNAEGKPITGGQLFRKYLLNRCQEDFERGWGAKEATAAAAATKALEDQAVKAAQEKNAGGDGGEEVALYSEEYYAAQKAKRQGLGLIKFIGELFKLQMLTERIMHECIKKLLGNVDNPEEEEIESLCKLLTTVGAILDSNSKARAHMDIYFHRMKELTKSSNVSARMQFMLQDVIELRERKWVSRNQIAAPTTIAQVHEAAAKEKADKESFQRQISMSRGGSRRGGDRIDHAQGDGWAIAGGSGPPRPSTKTTTVDFANFGKINRTAAPSNLGPVSVFAHGKKDPKRESTSSLSRTNSSSNMFIVLGESDGPKPARPLSRKASDEMTPPPLSDGPPPQRKKLMLQPRSKPASEEAPPAPEDASSEDESTMSEDEVNRRIAEDLKELLGVRNLNEAEVYFTNIPPEHRFRLVEKCVSAAIESKESDAQLVAEFFHRALAGGMCPPESFEEGFTLVAELLDDIAIDAPKAYDFMAMMLEGSGLDSDTQTRVAAKLENPTKLLDLLS